MNADTKQTCSTVQCNADAVGTVYWPGAELTMCAACIARAKEVAAAMGFVLSVEPLTKE